MKTPAEHYDSLLAPVYAWTLGDLDAAAARSAAELEDMEPPPSPGRAVDLGCGVGLHSIALAQRGFDVVAVDSSALLLAALRERASALPIRIVQADITEFRAHVAAAVDVIICLGDTLTHLPDRAAVEALLAQSAQLLTDGGMFAASFRDYASTTLQGDERFILVRRDADRILTCSLEYEAERVTVNDTLTERIQAQWVRRTSSYSKLRLAPDWVASRLLLQGLKVRIETAPAGMVRVMARRN